MEEGCPGTSLQETLSCDGPAHEEEERPGTPPPKRRGRRRGLWRAGSSGRWRLRVDRVAAGKFFADTGFPRPWLGSGCSCPPGPRVLILARAQAEVSSSQAAVLTGTQTRAPPSRPGCAARTRALSANPLPCRSPG